MSAQTEWKQKCRMWVAGRLTDKAALDAASTYLHESANWTEVRDFLILMAFDKRGCLNWFAEQDFPDFSEAVKQGWGWPQELEDVLA